MNPSQELLETIAMAKGHVTKAFEYVNKAYNLAIRDGFTPIEARNFLTAQLPFLAERTIRLALPAEAKNQNKVRHALPQNDEPKESNYVNITTKALIHDVDPEPEPELEDPRDIQIQMLKETNLELEEALRQTQQFKPATQLEAQPVSETKLDALCDDQVFKYLKERARETGNIIFIDRVGSGALAQSLYQYKGLFGVAELFLRIIK